MRSASPPVRKIAILAGALALSGCVVGPDYRRPELQAPAAYLYPAGQDAALADTPWWKAFDDPVLDGLIAEALAHNRNIRIAAAHVAQAAGVLQSTRSAFYPQVGYQANGGRYRLTNDGLSAQAAGISNPTNYYQALVGASWEIDLWGRVQRLSESAQANLLATEEARRGVILTLVASVANAYLQLRGLDEQLTMAQRTRDAYAESLRLMQAKFQYGRVSQMNVDQATARLQTAETQIPRIQRDIALLQDALAILLGRNPGEIPRGKSIFELTLPAVPAGVPSQLLERRPDLAQAEQQLIAANAQIGAAKALYYPTISLTAGAGQRQHRPVEPVQGRHAQLELRRHAGRADLHRRRDRRAGGAGRSRAARCAGVVPAGDPERLCRRRQCAGHAHDADRTTGGAGEAGQRAARLLAAGATAVRCRPRALFDRAAGRAGAVPGRAGLGRRPGEAVPRRSSASTRRWAVAGSARRTSSPPSARRPAQRREVNGGANHGQVRQVQVEEVGARSRRRSRRRSPPNGHHKPRRHRARRRLRQTVEATPTARRSTRSPTSRPS